MHQRAQHECTSIMHQCAQHSVVDSRQIRHRLDQPLFALQVRHGGGANHTAHFPRNRPPRQPMHQSSHAHHQARIVDAVDGRRRADRGYDLGCRRRRDAPMTCRCRVRTVCGPGSGRRCPRCRRLCRPWTTKNRLVFCQWREHGRHKMQAVHNKKKISGSEFE